MGAHVWKRNPGQGVGGWVAALGFGQMLSLLSSISHWRVRVGLNEP